IPAARWPSAEEAAASLLFKPIEVGSVTLNSRTWVPAMVPWRATEDGFVTSNILDWYGRFARGQPGAIVVEATGVRDVPSGPLLRIGHDRFIPGLRELVDTVRRESKGKTRLFIQLIDFLAVKRRPEKETYFARFFLVKPQHRAALAEATRNYVWLTVPEDEVRRLLATGTEQLLEQVLDERELESLRYGYRERVTDQHLAHVQDLPRVLPGIFAEAAVRAREAEFD